MLPFPDASNPTDVGSSRPDARSYDRAYTPYDRTHSFYNRVHTKASCGFDTIYWSHSFYAHTPSSKQSSDVHQRYNDHADVINVAPHHLPTIEPYGRG